MNEAGVQVPRGSPSLRSLPGQRGRAERGDPGLGPSTRPPAWFSCTALAGQSTPRLATATATAAVTATALREPTGWHQSQPWQTHSISRKGHRSLVLSEASPQGLPEVTELAGSAGFISGRGTSLCTHLHDWTAIIRNLTRAVWGPGLCSQSHGQARWPHSTSPRVWPASGMVCGSVGRPEVTPSHTVGGQPAQRGGKGIPIETGAREAGSA